MKKRSLVIFLALIASLCLSACGEKRTRPTAEDVIEQSNSTLEILSKNADERDKQREELIEKNRVELKDELFFSASELDVKIKAYSVINWTSLGEETQQLYLIFDYTNKDTEDNQLHMQANLTCYQDGITLSAAPYVDNNSFNAIRPGTTIELMNAFILRNEDSDVQIKLTTFEGGESAEYTIKIK